MCIAVAAQVLSVDANAVTARVTVSGNELTVDCRLVRCAPGDHVLVHAGCAIEVLREDAARELEELMLQIEELARDGH